MSGDNSVNGTVILARIQLCVFLGRVVKNLQLAQSDVSCVAFARVSNRQTVVSSRRDFEFQSSDEVSQILVVIDRAASSLLAANSSVDDFVVFDRACPTVERFSVEDRRES